MCGLKPERKIASGCIVLLVETMKKKVTQFRKLYLRGTLSVTR